LIFKFFRLRKVFSESSNFAKSSVSLLLALPSELRRNGLRRLSETVRRFRRRFGLESLSGFFNIELQRGSIDSKLSIIRWSEEIAAGRTIGGRYALLARPLELLLTDVIYKFILSRDDTNGARSSAVASTFFSFRK
jgi:hypothetical protein